MLIVDCSSYGMGTGIKPKPRKRLRPYDDRGRFVPLACRNPECIGTLKHEGDGWWECDGLVDPGDPSKELQVCSGFDHYNGDAYPRRVR
jgi:hypothetical protein